MEEAVACGASGDVTVNFTQTYTIVDDCPASTSAPVDVFAPPRRFILVSLRAHPAIVIPLPAVGLSLLHPSALMVRDRDSKLALHLIIFIYK